MANEEHLALIKQGTTTWNDWRKENSDIQPDLADANLREADLEGANLMDANLREADLEGANLMDANLGGADLEGANLDEANLRFADLSNASLKGAVLRYADLHKAELSFVSLCEADLKFTNLYGVNLYSAYLQKANLCKAKLIDADLFKANFGAVNLHEANLEHARLVETNFENANLSGCLVYGISAWGLKLKGANQTNLVITPDGEPTITVDNLEVAQFIYLLLNNQKIREVIDTITSKTVLILGCFTEQRKQVLDVLRDELRNRGYLPILFDFDKPASRDTVETISTLAHIARFVIADLTDARSVLQELQCVVPALPSVPVQPILLASAHEYGMLDHIRRYPWVLETYQYQSPEELLASVETIITPAEVKAKEMLGLG